MLCGVTTIVAVLSPSASGNACEVVTPVVAFGVALTPLMRTDAAGSCSVKVTVAVAVVAVAVSVR